MLFTLAENWIPLEPYQNFHYYHNLNYWERKKLLFWRHELYLVWFHWRVFMIQTWKNICKTNKTLCWKYWDKITDNDSSIITVNYCLLQEFQREEMYCINKTEQVSKQFRSSGCHALQWFEDKVKNLKATCPFNNVFFEGNPF